MFIAYRDPSRRAPQGAKCLLPISLLKELRNHQRRNNYEHLVPKGVLAHCCETG